MLNRLIQTLVILLSLNAAGPFSVTAAAASKPDWPTFRSALVLWIEKPSSSEICSGVAVDRKIVLTAAHCLDGARSVKVSFGREPVLQPDKALNGVRWSIHPKYDRDRSFFLNDLGILELADALPDEVPLAVVATLAELKSDQVRLERIGFGRRNGLIRRTWTDPVYRGIAGERAIVTRDLHAVAGDSGGPVFARLGGRLRLVGIHSTLQKGGRALSVSVVPTMTDWISMRSLSSGGS